MPDFALLGLASLLVSAVLLAVGERSPARLGGASATGAARYRAVSLLVVAAFGCLLRDLCSEPAARDEVSYLLVITVGYGHLIGAAWFSLGRVRVPAGVSAPLLVLFALTSIATLFAAWSWAANEGSAYVLPHFLWIFFGLFAVSTWHVIENDIALARSYRAGLRLTGLSRRRGDQLFALAGTAMLTGIGVHLVQAPSRWLSFGDLFTAIILYHLVGWLVFFADRARRLEGRARRELLARLALVHLPPAALAGLLMAWTPPGLAGLRELVFGPGVYSFFALLHVVQTAWVRGLEERRAC